jgi:hypothetical protein
MKTALTMSTSPFGKDNLVMYYIGLFVLVYTIRAFRTITLSDRRAKIDLLRYVNTHMRASFISKWSSASCMLVPSPSSQFRCEQYGKSTNIINIIIINSISSEVDMLIITAEPPAQDGTWSDDASRTCRR